MKTFRHHGSIVRGPRNQRAMSIRLTSVIALHSLWRPAVTREFATLKTVLPAAAGIQNSLRERGVRLTRQRRILLDLLDRSGKHLNAETLYQLAKEKDPKLNRVTVYRTLKLLKAGGLIDELDLLHFEGDQHYYESRLKQEHAHLICLRCGKVEEFFGEPLQKMRRQMESSLGFKIITARTEMGGYCPDCQSQLAQESAEKARAGQIG
jgi:Fur family ferric uptake transcriptional regulator